MATELGRSVRVETLEPRTLLAAGALDPTFVNGTTRVEGPGDDAASAVAALPDGGFVVAGASQGSASSGAAVIRYLPGGGVDPSFGRGGQVFLPLGWGPDVAMAARPDGRTATAGSPGHDVQVVRLLRGGKVDRSFGDGGTGTITLAPEQSAQPRRVAIAP